MCSFRVWHTHPSTGSQFRSSNANAGPSSSQRGAANPNRSSTAKRPPVSRMTRIRERIRGACRAVPGVPRHARHPARTRTAPMPEHSPTELGRQTPLDSRDPRRTTRLFASAPTCCSAHTRPSTRPQPPPRFGSADLEVVISASNSDRLRAWEGSSAAMVSSRPFKRFPRAVLKAGAFRSGSRRKPVCDDATHAIPRTSRFASVLRQCVPATRPTTTDRRRPASREARLACRLPRRPGRAQRTSPIRRRPTGSTPQRLLLEARRGSLPQ